MKIMPLNNKPTYLGRDLEAMSFAKNYHKWLIDEFKPYFGQSVAEVGAGTGNFSELLMQHIKHLVAFEPSETMYPLLKERFSENPGVKTINSIFASECSKFEGCLDSIIYINVLEHIENDKQELSCVYKTLRHGGHALIFVPALSFLYSDHDKNMGHFRRYHKKDLVKLVQHIGFNIRKAKYFDLAGIIPWYIAFVLLKKSVTGGKVSLYDKLAVPLMQKVERFITPPVGKNLLLVIQKA
jgi:SAM-dependent methyltransferase